jgi:hypothetical protein
MEGRYRKIDTKWVRQPRKGEKRHWYHGTGGDLIVITDVLSGDPLHFELTWPGRQNTEYWVSGPFDDSQLSFGWVESGRNHVDVSHPVAPVVRHTERDGKDLLVECLTYLMDNSMDIVMQHLEWVTERLDRELTLRYSGE